MNRLYEDTIIGGFGVTVHNSELLFNSILQNYVQQESFTEMSHSESKPQRVRAVKMLWSIGGLDPIPYGNDRHDFLARFIEVRDYLLSHHYPFTW